jgi:argininosuccinate lyase
LRVFTGMLGGLSVNPEAMRRAAAEGFATATDLADYLVRRGVPFREAHEIVGGVVRHALAAGKTLTSLSLDELRRFSDRFADDVAAALSVDAALRARAVTGGTAPEAVRRALTLARSLVDAG